MKKTNLDIKDVVRIRRSNRNPDVTFAPKVHYRDLENKNYKEIVNIFYQKIHKWYFKVAEYLYKNQRNLAGANFSIMILDCIIIDLLSQYFSGSPASSRTAFKEFVNERILKNSQKKLTLNIQSCSYDNGSKKWKEEKIDTVADALYFGFRCGLVHSAGILEYGRINYLYKKSAIRIVPWKGDKKKIDVHINPGILLLKLKGIFIAYKKTLLAETDKQLKDNFLKKFELEYGIKVKKLSNHSIQRTLPPPFGRRQSR